ncbi:MAG: hypothetical protein QGG14_06600 [Planctomycetota bacterium]|jgi:hypothetical protein|nr:hypothetical protein [Planctomycetota bacterium]
MGLKIWDDAVTAAARVLELEENEEARRILQRAQANLGDRLPDMAEHTRQQHIRAELEKQRDLFRARDFLHQGDLASRQNEFVKAHQMFERARLTLQYSPWFTPGSDLEKTISGKIRQALEDQKAWLRRRTERIASGTRTRLMEDEREARLRQERKVSELFTQSNLAFQHKRYGRSIELLDEALELDPLSQDAKDLRELAMRATHDSNLDRIKRDWRRHWAATFQELQSSDVTQVDPIKHDLLRWREVTSKRKPLEFSTYDVEEDPDTAEILKTLEQNVVATEFDEMQLTAWVDYYRRATGLTIAPSPKVHELDEAETTLFNFKIGKKSVRKALDLIARIKPLKWQVSDGIVHILTKDEGSGAMVPRIYDVREIINPLAQHPGRDILLAVGEGDEDLGDEEEPTPAVVDVDKLQELIRANVMPDTWEADGVSINPQGPTLVINQTLAVHAAIDKLLGDLRGTSGIQVDIEARFLRVEDNFLEEVGVDFRGLGNQASEGKAGMGLQGDRTGFGFDDYGTNTSASAPTEVGSGFEPGIFYNDGGDGDIFGRTENLFDRVLGGGEEGLSNAGGLAFQWTYLDDTEIEIILRAVQKQERVEQISAPRLLVHNTARAHLAVNRQFSYIRDFNVEIAQAAAVADPVVSVVRDGVILDVRPVVAADRKYILMELRPTVATLALPIPTFTTSLGVGQPVSIQLPRLTLQKVRTTVVMPDGGTLLLGGMKNVQKHSFDSGVPILKELPGLSFLFSHKGTYRANKKILILLRASVVIPPEWEPAQRK